MRRFQLRSPFQPSRVGGLKLNHPDFGHIFCDALPEPGTTYL